MGVEGEGEQAQNPSGAALDNKSLGDDCIEHLASRAFWIFSGGGVKGGFDYRVQCGFMYRLLAINSWNKTDSQSELPSLIHFSPSLPRPEERADPAK